MNYFIAVMCTVGAICGLVSCIGAFANIPEVNEGRLALGLVVFALNAFIATFAWALVYHKR